MLLWLFTRMYEKMAEKTLNKFIEQVDKSSSLVDHIVRSHTDIVRDMMGTLMERMSLINELVNRVTSIENRLEGVNNQMISVLRMISQIRSELEENGIVPPVSYTTDGGCPEEAECEYV